MYPRVIWMCYARHVNKKGNADAQRGKDNEDVYNDTYTK